MRLSWSNAFGGIAAAKREHVRAKSAAAAADLLLVPLQRRRCRRRLQLPPQQPLLLPQLRLQRLLPLPQLVPERLLRLPGLVPELLQLAPLPRRLRLQLPLPGCGGVELRRGRLDGWRLSSSCGLVLGPDYRIAASLHALSYSVLLLEAAALLRRLAGCASPAPLLLHPSFGASIPVTGINTLTHAHTARTAPRPHPCTQRSLHRATTHAPPFASHPTFPPHTTSRHCNTLPLTCRLPRPLLEPAC